MQAKGAFSPTEADFLEEGSPALNLIGWREMGRVEAGEEAAGREF